MKGNKKLIIIICSLIILGIVVFMIINSKNKEEGVLGEITEYTPQEEISDEQMRETKVILYFLNKETKELKSEGKLINANELLENPYKKIVELLIEGPNSTDLANVFPKNTRVLDAKIEKRCITLNFSEEIVKFEDDVQKYNIINSILNSLTELNEVDSIKILVNNQTNEAFDEEYSAIY